MATAQQNPRTGPLSRLASGVFAGALAGVVAGGLILAGGAFVLSVPNAAAEPGQAGNSGCGCVVSVNITAIIEQLDQRREAENALQTLSSEMQAKDVADQEALKAMAAQIEPMAEDDSARQALLDKFNLSSVEYQAWREYAKEHLDIEKSLLLREMDRKVREAIAELAQINGYDLVVIEDASRELTVNPESQMPRELQVKQQMGNRRLMYAGGKGDITADVVARMNNAFQNGG